MWRLLLQVAPYLCSNDGAFDSPPHETELADRVVAMAASTSQPDFVFAWGNWVSGRQHPAKA